jgi:polyisoprenoid-binding protein YceI
MRKLSVEFLAFAVVITLLAASAPVQAADDYAVDPAHTSIGFKISHLGLSWVHGRFDGFSGGFAIDPDDPAKSAFALTINAETIDTNNQKRDDHLRSPDFFNVKQYPAISFKSTSVKAIPDGYQVTGELTMHGATRPLTLNLTGGKKMEFPKGVARTGFSTDLTLKRSEFGMEKFNPMVGDDVVISVSFEGTKK